MPGPRTARWAIQDQGLLGKPIQFFIQRSDPRKPAPDLERTIISIRQRLVSQVHPGTRYSLIGARSILAELEALHICLLPSLRTIERVLQQA